MATCSYEKKEKEMRSTISDSSWTVSWKQSENVVIYMVFECWCCCTLREFNWVVSCRGIFLEIVCCCIRLFGIFFFAQKAPYFVFNFFFFFFSRLRTPAHIYYWSLICLAIVHLFGNLKIYYMIWKWNCMWFNQCQQCTNIFIYGWLTKDFNC